LTNKLLAGTALCGAFIGCGPDVAEVSNPDSQTKGSVQFIVTDSETGALLDSVSIERFIEGTNKTIFSDSTGEASVKSLGNGEYRFLLSKEGYASVWQTATLGIENDESDAPMIYDEVFAMSLNELGAEVKGKVYYNDKDGNKQIAEGAKVELSIPTNYVNRLFTATTDENGEYTFSDLPENINYSIKVLKFTDADDVIYNSASKSVSGVKAGDTEKTNPLFVTIDARSFTQLNSNLEELTASDTIMLSFSEAINTSEL